MTKHDIATLSCRLLGIYAFISALNYLQGSFQTVYFAFNITWQQSGWDWEHLFYILIVAGVPCALGLIFGMFLWLSAGNLATAMTRDMQSLPSQAGLDRGDVQAIAFSVIGLLTIIQTCSRIGYRVSYYFINYGTFGAGIPGRGGTPLMATTWIEIVTLAVLMLIGCALLFGSRRLAGFLDRAGQEMENSPKS
jgi:hypothetical protein